MSSARVTWLLPVKNGMPFLCETLASIAAQSYDHYYVLAWDNGSTDGSVEELARWIPERLPGKVVSNLPLGLGDSLAKMVELADTDFCARIDSDDVNFPHRLERQVAFMNSHPMIAAVGSQVIRIDERGAEHGQHYQLPLNHDDIVHRLIHSWAIWHPSVLFRRTAVMAVGNYHNIQPVEDYDLWMRLAAKFRLANLDECLVKYRVHDAGVTAMAAKSGRLSDAIGKVVIRNAPKLFGCSEDEMVDFRNSQRLFSLPLVFKIARHLGRSQGGGIRGRFRSQSFRQAMGQFVSKLDVLTSVVLACCQPSLRGGIREIRCAMLEGLSFLVVGAAVRLKSAARKLAI